MKNSSFPRTVHRLVHGFTGCVFLALAALFVVAPLPSYTAVALLFGVGVLVAGVLESLYAVFLRHELPGWGWHLAAGLLDVGIGIWLNAYPALTLTLLPMLTAFWLIWRGLTLCAHASTRRHSEPPSQAPLRRGGFVEWGFGLGAILWGMGMLWWPAEGVVTVISLLAVALALMGVWRLVFAFRT